MSENTFFVKQFSLRRLFAITWLCAVASFVLSFVSPDFWIGFFEPFQIFMYLIGKKPEFELLISTGGLSLFTIIGLLVGIICALFAAFGLIIVFIIFVQYVYHKIDGS